MRELRTSDGAPRAVLSKLARKDHPVSNHQMNGSRVLRGITSLARRDRLAKQANAPVVEKIRHRFRAVRSAIASLPDPARTKAEDDLLRIFGVLSTARAVADDDAAAAKGLLSHVSGSLLVLERQLERAA